MDGEDETTKGVKHAKKEFSAKIANGAKFRVQQGVRPGARVPGV
jgi:hypothetical protein